jgi:two-component system nitrogen regulation response regulator NtrX
VLEANELSRVGGHRMVPLHVRVVAATNRSLDAEVEAGRFRQDLLYRLNVHVLEVPPLRERLSDVPELAEHLLGVLCQRLGLRPKRLAPDAAEVLMRYDWRKNNVRELRNVLERMAIATPADVLGPELVPADVRNGGALGTASRTGGAGRTFVEQKAEAERQIIVAALERNDWHITKTAQELGLADHSSLIKIMKRHGIARE